MIKNEDKTMRFIARFANDNGNNFEIIDIYENKIERTVVDKNKPIVKSITKKYPGAIWFERKIKDDFGIEFEGSFDNRALNHHERFPDIYPMKKDFNQKEIDFSEPKPYKYEVIDGDGVFEVSVGPIHAGIIESGHFQFSQEGENILHLEVRHFYTYKGIEKMCENKKPLEIFSIIEKISGKDSLGYQNAYLDILAQATHQNVPLNIKKYNALLLEIERCANHIADLGAIPNDGGFSPALAFCSQKSEELKRILQVICGHRFGFGAIRGYSKEFDKNKIIAFFDNLEKEMKWFEDWIVDIPSLWDRLDTTGILTTQNAIKYSCVGVMAKASGVEMDTRNNNFYKEHGFIQQKEKTGDVAARFKIRLKEVFNSVEMIRNFINFEEEKIEFNEFFDGEYYSFVESSIGELFMFVKIKNGVIDRFFSKDPSFSNWQALHTMMSGNIIADFPLINKSCDLSYSGNDL